MKDLCGYQTVQLPPAYPFTLDRFASNTALILPSEADQCRSEISLLATPETFTHRRRQRISAGSPCASGSVNGAADYRLCLLLVLTVIFSCSQSSTCLTVAITFHGNRKTVFHTAAHNSKWFIALFWVALSTLWLITNLQSAGKNSLWGCGDGFGVQIKSILFI